MNWEEIKTVITNSILVGQDINTHRSTFRIVEKAPPYQCGRYDYNQAEGFLVRIGRNSNVEIPMTMLERLFNSSLNNNNIYNSTIFRNRYPKQKKDHPCHIHSVGKIFEYAGIMEQIDSRNYRIII